MGVSIVTRKYTLFSRLANIEVQTLFGGKFAEWAAPALSEIVELAHDALQ